METVKQDNQVSGGMQGARRWRGVKYVADWLDCTETTVWAMVRDGRLPPPTRFSSQMLRWHDDDLKAYVDKVRGVEK